MENCKLYLIPVMLGTNCYLLVDANKEAALIDPGGGAQLIMKTAEDDGAKIVAIINTHGHWDHVGANREMQELSGAPILIHAEDAALLGDPQQNLAQTYHATGDGGQAARLLHDGDTIEIGGLSLRVIHTPGHTQGSICLTCEDLLFTGDTLFQLSVGRADLPGGDEDALMKTLTEKLAPLPGNMRVLPGHGPESTLDYERKYNPYFPR